MRRPSLAPLFLLCLPLAASALAVGKDSPEDFAARSRRDPGRLYALVVGASWCQPCHRLAAELAGYASTGTPVGEAVWDFVETDRYGTEAFAAFLSSADALVAGEIPSVLVFRGGRALGYSTVGADLPGIEKFLADAGAHERAARPLSSLICPGARDPASFTLGIAGYKSQNDRSTDGFGIGTMLAFRAQDRPSPARFLAPGGPLPDVVADPAPSRTGALLSSSPLRRYRDLIEPVEGSTSALKDLARAPGASVRLVLTGHAGPAGMTVGFDAGDPAFAQPAVLTEPMVAAAVRSARAAGKTVRAVALTCFGGQFGEAFMPRGGEAAPACAAFATLPDKPAEGCYSDSVVGDGSDYLQTLEKSASCPRRGGGRALHYAALARNASRDVPMLSSEYFLLFGPAAAYLGRGDRGPSPPRGLLRAGLASGVDVYFDLVGGGVLRAVKDGRDVPLPRASLADCRKVSAFAGMDGEHASGFFLHGRSSGPGAAEHADCAPLVRLDWDAGEGESFPSETVDLDAGVLDLGARTVYEPTSALDYNLDWTRKIAQTFAPDGPQADLTGLEPEARVLIKVVLPLFAAPLSGDALEKRLDLLAGELRPFDRDEADALAELAGSARRDAEKPAASPAGALTAAVEEILTVPAAPAAPGAPAAPAAEAVKTSDFDTTRLTQAMLFNIAPGEYGYAHPVSSARLAHLAAAAAAELELRREAKSSPNARRLLAQLESLKSCEEGLY